MGHPDLNIDVSQFSPLLDAQKVKQLENQWVFGAVSLYFINDLIIEFISFITVSCKWHNFKYIMTLWF